VLGEDEHHAAAQWLLDHAAGLLGADVEWWPDGLGGAAASPGLMTGMAGTLLVLLRATNIGGVPGPGLFPLGASSPAPTAGTRPPGFRAAGSATRARSAS
jgi:hypothetical protein